MLGEYWDRQSTALPTRGAAGQASGSLAARGRDVCLKEESAETPLKTFDS